MVQIGGAHADSQIINPVLGTGVVDLPRVAAFFEAATPPADALIISAEAGSAWTLLYPDYEVVLPFPDYARWSLTYVTGSDDPGFLRYLDLWIELVRNEGMVTRLHDHWMLGRTAVPPSHRWSIIRDVLHWVD